MITAIRRAYVPGSQLRFACGDLIRHAEEDGREDRIARVEASFNATIRVRWLDTGYREDLHMEDALVLVRAAAPAEAPAAPRARPSTVVESPRAKLERWMAERRAAL